MSMQDILSTAQLVNSQLNNIKQKVENIQASAAKIETKQPTIKEIEYTVYRIIGMLQRLGLPEEINKALQILQEAIFIVRSLTVALAALELATPMGYIKAAIGFAGAGFAALDSLRGV